ncbi:SRPBCC domain-containing protein [Constantimarinum furrinae]|uniref:Hsp90 ATPase 1 family protein Activator n=1 Tax=Constantimarinum furrinae TaxID=2562285 RepID=A0A7G8PWM5_9FLAO|nr:SRPBCC domain-containing protein [Constantimarinum furrinae]QNJ98741.1 Hsp90 ATPase 1 family protein Activator [Constantimarinum furrinae]
MKRKEFKIKIDATPHKVWDVLWSDKTYPEWTKVFSDGSHAKTDWQEGSKVLFLDGKGNGMVSRIRKKIDGHYMSFEHLGYVKDDEEILSGEEVEKWQGGQENYTLIQNDGKTELQIEMDIMEEYLDKFNDTFPKALNEVKRISEINKQNQ